MFNKTKVTTQGKKVYEQIVCFSSFDNDNSNRKTDNASWLEKYIDKTGVLTIYLFEENKFFCYNPFNETNKIDDKKGIFSSPIKSLSNDTIKIILTDLEGIIYCFTIVN